MNGEPFVYLYGSASGRVHIFRFFTFEVFTFAFFDFALVGFAAALPAAAVFPFAAVVTSAKPPASVSTHIAVHWGCEPQEIPATL
jgi:hypothetical protein